MKNLIAIFAILSCTLTFTAKAQTPPVIYYGANNQTTVNKGGYAIDSLFWLPLTDTTNYYPFGYTRKIGRMVVRKADSATYIYNGAAWQRLAVSGSLGSYVKYADSLTTFVTNTRLTASALYYTKYADSVTRYVTPTSLATAISGAGTDTTSLSNRINLRVKYTDSVISYVTPTSLATAISGAGTDTTSLSNRINLRVKYTDSVTSYVTPSSLGTASGSYVKYPDTLTTIVTNTRLTAAAQYFTKYADSVTYYVTPTSLATAISGFGTTDTTSLSNRINLRVKYADSSTTFITQAGNSFGAAMNIGTNDAQFVNIRASGSTKLTFTTSGVFASVPINNSSSAANASITFAAAGVQVSRNVADASPSALITQTHATSTGNILSLANSTGIVARITQAGKLVIKYDSVGLGTNKIAVMVGDTLKAVDPALSFWKPGGNGGGLASYAMGTTVSSNWTMIKNNFLVATISSFGIGLASGFAIYGPSGTGADGKLLMPLTGPTITRDIADANPAFSITQVNASSTGDILRLSNSTGIVAKITQAGALQTAQPSATGVAVIFSGKVVSGVAVPADKYQEIKIDGTLYWIRVYTALP